MHPIIAKLQAKDLKKIPEVKTGYTVRVSQKVKEGSKERIQNFEGLVIKVGHGAGVEKNFTIRKMVEGIGVEKIFPFHSPTITKIHVVKKAKVRREKLYYMRDRFGKSARLTEKQVTDEERTAEQAKMDALYDEAVKADEKAKKEEIQPSDQLDKVEAEVKEEAPIEEKIEEKAVQTTESPEKPEEEKIEPKQAEPQAQMPISESEEQKSEEKKA